MQFLLYTLDIIGSAIKTKNKKEYSEQIPAPSAVEGPYRTMPIPIIYNIEVDKIFCPSGNSYISQNIFILPSQNCYI